MEAGQITVYPHSFPFRHDPRRTLWCEIRHQTVAPGSLANSYESNLFCRTGYKAILQLHFVFVQVLIIHLSRFHWPWKLFWHSYPFVFCFVIFKVNVKNINSIASAEMKHFKWTIPIKEVIHIAIVYQLELLRRKQIILTNLISSSRSIKVCQKYSFIFSQKTYQFPVMWRGVHRFEYSPKGKTPFNASFVATNCSWRLC